MTRFALALTTWLLTAVVHADVAPPPTRPEWPDTPVPTPSEPLILLALVVSFLALQLLRARRS